MTDVKVRAVVEFEFTDPLEEYPYGSRQALADALNRDDGLLFNTVIDAYLQRGPGDRFTVRDVHVSEVP